MGQTILEIDNIKVRYSGLPVLQGISLKVDAGETVCVLGSNGAGKSTLIRAIMGTQPAFEGRILFKDRQIQKLKTAEIVRSGIVCVPEEKMLFSLFMRYFPPWRSAAHNPHPLCPAANSKWWPSAAA